VGYIDAMKQAALCLVWLLVASPLPAANNGAVDAANAKSFALVGKPAPDFSLKDFDQQSFSLSNQRGHVVVLAFWGTWCPPCRSELPGFDALQKELATSGDMLIAIAVDDPAKARGYLARKHLTFRCLDDQNATAAGLFGAHALPKTIIIKRDGTVAVVFGGPVKESQLRLAIAKAAAD
jgi:peroxiredoxin